MMGHRETIVTGNGFTNPVLASATPQPSPNPFRSSSTYYFDAPIMSALASHPSCVRLVRLFARNSLDVIEDSLSGIAAESGENARHRHSRFDELLGTGKEAKEQERERGAKKERRRMKSWTSGPPCED